MIHILNTVYDNLIARLESWQVESAIARTISSRSYDPLKSHPQVHQLEKQLGSLLGNTYAVGTNSGTDALVLALKTLGVGSGDEVIVPAYGFVATASCVSWVCATPVFVDVRYEDHMIDPTEVRKAITPRTKAIIVAHLFGQVSPAINELVSLARDHNIYIIEDASHAFRSGIINETPFRDTNGNRESIALAGTFGDIGCFSLSASKQFSTFGNAGVLITKSEQIQRKAKSLSFYGAKRHYREYPNIGINLCMQDIHAAILTARLPHYEHWRRRSGAIAAVYREYLSDIPELTLPSIQNNVRLSSYRFAVKTSRRNEIFEWIHNHLDKRIDARPIKEYPVPIPYFEAFSSTGHVAGDFPVSELLCNETFSLPTHRIGGILKMNEVILLSKLIRSFFDRKQIDL